MDKPKWTDVAIVILTGGIVFLAYLQWREMHDAGTQTDKIIAADERLAGAVEASNVQSENALKATLAEGQKSLDASIEAFRADQRAWLGVKEIILTHALEAGKPIDITINTFNSGKSPALDAGLVETSIGPSETQADIVAPSKDRAVVAPNNNEMNFTSATVSDSVIAGLLARKSRFYIRGKIVYRDIFKRSHETRFCAYYPTSGTTLNLFNCGSGNSMN